VWIHPEHDFIGFMLDERLERMSHKLLQEVLGVATSDRKLHQIVYGDAPPCCSRAASTFPMDEQIRSLFRDPFIDGSLCTPDRLCPGVYILHMALRKAVMPRGGNRESLTSLQ
jgi:hypothetical protein